MLIFQMWHHFQEVYLGPSKVSPAVKSIGGESHGTHSPKLSKPPSELCHLLPGGESGGPQAFVLFTHYTFTHQQCIL